VSGALIYLLTAIAGGITSLALLAKSRRGDITRRGALACFVTGIWALVLAGQASMGIRGAWSVLLMEALRYGAWFVALHALAPVASRWLTRASTLLVAAVSLYALAGWWGGYSGSYYLRLDGALESAGLALAFFGLVLTEQAWRNAPEQLWRPIALCAVGAGGQFAFDLFLFSQAHLLGGMDAGAWALRGVFGAVLVATFAAGALRMPATDARLFVSRHMVFYSTAFIAVGMYLCVMALGGYYVRQQSGTWGNALQVVFLFGAVAILALLLLSGSALRRLRVFIATHFYRNKYDYRIEWLRFVQTLSSAEEHDLHRTVVRAVAQIFGSPAGLLMLKSDDEDRYTLRASWPEPTDGMLEGAAIGADDPLAEFLRSRQWVIDLREFANRPQLYGDLQLPSWLPADGPWRVISPLLLGNELLGFLVLRTPPEPFTMNFEDRDLLKTVGRNVAVQLAQRQADEKLAQGRQFDAYNRFAAFVMHDLKNAVAQLQLVVNNAARHRHNPVFVDDAIGTIQNTSERMTRLIDQLQSRDMGGTSREIDVVPLAGAAVARSAARDPRVTLQAGPAPVMLRADPERLGTVIDHVIRNAQEATPPGARVELRVEAVDGEAHIHVIDEGAGMEPEFVRERLFKPFDSTKGSKGMGIGAYQAREYARSLGGDVEVQSKPGKGTDFCIRLPLCPKTNPDY
jgi:putative PEP-CTERM system histidine kinase